jgi:hypothetical protein
MTEQERSQKLEATLQALIGQLHFRIAILQVENEELRAQLLKYQEAVAMDKPDKPLRAVQ